MLNWVRRCRGYWHDMVQERAVMPNEGVLGCVLDALVCNGEVSEAAALFPLLFKVARLTSEGCV